mmetsp:Transcript_93730/g.180872  ORF Transcript_93730/g.180872 Transcript_93730/m.180872 type:complete len:424 (+) Transcript_93730:49-1320(+)
MALRGAVLRASRLRDGYACRISSSHSASGGHLCTPIRPHNVFLGCRPPHAHCWAPLRRCSTVADKAPLKATAVSTSDLPKPAVSMSDAPTPVLPLNLVQKPAIQRPLPILGQMAYVMLSAGFMMTDILVLRTTLAFGYMLLTGYHIFQLRPLRVPLVGSFVFVLVNLYFGFCIYLDRQVHLTEEEHDIYDRHFASVMQDHEFEKLLRAGEHVQLSERSRLVASGDVHKKLFFILKGTATASFSDESHLRLQAGTFIGEGAFISGNAPKSRSSVDAAAGCLYLCWDLDRLSSLATACPAVQRALFVKVGSQLANKWDDATGHLAEAEHQLLAMRICLGRSPDLERNLKRAYCEWDDDGSGSICFTEFNAMMTSMASTGGQQGASHEQLRSLFETIDKDGSGEISREEFLSWLRRVHPKSKSSSF